MADSTSEFQPYQPHHEKTPSQESAKIPENWKFQERSNPNLNIIQLEPDSNFLAFNYQYKRNPTDAFYRQENRDYFFDTNGNITHYCGRSKKPGASIGITADGIKSVYVINPNEGLGWILFPNSEDREEDFPSFLRGRYCLRS